MKCPISELVEADAEVGCGEIAVRFRFAVLFAEEDGSGFGGPGDGQSEQNEESVEFSRIGEPGIFEVEAAGFDVAEGALDGPAFLVGFKRAGILEHIHFMKCHSLLCEIVCALVRLEQTDDVAHGIPEGAAASFGLCADQ